jgi:TPR repeat protein
MRYVGKMIITGSNIEGNVFEKDEQQGIQWLEKAIEQRDYRAMTVLGYHLITVSPSNSELVKRGMNLLYRAAHAGWPKAMTKLGEVLLSGTAVYGEQGKYWLEKAVHHGHPAASYQLGKRLFYGLDYPQDETTGMALLEGAAKKIIPLLNCY